MASALEQFVQQLLLDNEGTVKILDMGLARIEGDTAGQAELTGTGAVMGTVDYMSPEQALDTKSADARADIYSLGCSLFYLLTGRATYGGDTLMAKLLAHRDQPVPDLQTMGLNVPGRLEAVFKKMVAKKIADRYQTMTDVIADLENCTAAATSAVDGPLSATVQLEESALSFLKDVPDRPTIQATAAGLHASPAAGGKAGPLWKNTKVQIGGGILGLLILIAGIYSSLNSSNGPPINDQKSGKAKPIPAIKKEGQPLFFETPGFAPWAKEVRALPAQQQVERVSRKMMELIPGFDGKFIEDPHRVRDGVAWRLQVYTDNVSDISPIRVLAGLQILQCTGSADGKGQLRDLSPLQGMAALTELYCDLNPGVRDLAPLRGLALTSLSCDYTRVSDLGPLRGMQLQNLNITDSSVADLSALEGMPLESLNCSGTKVSNLSPLAGMKLRYLWSYATPVDDLSVLKGMPLTNLHLGGTKVSNLSPLQGMPLELFVCDAPVDLSPLRGMPLRMLDCNFKPERDTKVLRSIKTLESINGKPTAEFWKDVEGQK